jgi:hypothetical protein
MKKLRATAMLLILVLTTSPALAAICATSCATQSVLSSLQSSDMTEMQNCHEDSMNNKRTKSGTEHKSCAMGAACFFGQLITQIDSISKYVFADSTKSSFLKFVPFEKSIDLSPPLKPPA